MECARCLGPVVADHGDGLCGTCHLRAEIARLTVENTRLRETLGRLAFAAQCRESTMGDPCRLLEVKAELAAAAKQARAALQPAGLAELQEGDHA